MRDLIQNKTYDEERALYHLEHADVVDCTFAGPADGESALKEARDVTVKNCTFSLRYPFWHTRSFQLIGSTLDEKTRAPIWYAEDGEIVDTTVTGVKCLRECDRMTLRGCDVTSPEFGWRCRGVNIVRSSIGGEYFLFETRGGEIDGLHLKGKYSFQYTEDLHVKNSVLDTKDAFWHAKNVTVEDSEIKGEYLAWYSENLTLIRCHISGTQPLCYCKNLRLIDCTMEGTDLSFEYSDVEATVKGSIDSVKNPASGYIEADAIGEIILADSIMESTCDIRVRK